MVMNPMSHGTVVSFWGCEKNERGKMGEEMNGGFFSHPYVC